MRLIGVLLTAFMLMSTPSLATVKTLVDTDSSQTLVNKTMTSPVLTTPTVSGAGTLTGWTCATCTLSGAITSSGTFSALTTTGLLTTGSGANVVTTAAGLLKATMLDNGAWAIPGAIGGTTPSTGKFTTVESTIATGTAPFTVASTTVVSNLNVSSLLGSTWAIPGTIGSTTPTTGVFTTVKSTTYQATAGSGTGITVNDAGAITIQIYKVTITSTQFISNATTHDLTWVTVPAKARVLTVFADLTQTFACASVCTTATLSIIVGKTVGGNEYLVSFDADAAAAQFGDADAEFGASLTRAGSIAAGDLPSWSGATALKLRMTSGTGNLGNGTTTNLSQGSITLYLVYYIFP